MSLSYLLAAHVDNCTVVCNSAAKLCSDSISMFFVFVQISMFFVFVQISMFFVFVQISMFSVFVQTVKSKFWKHRRSIATIKNMFTCFSQQVLVLRRTDVERQGTSVRRPPPVPPSSESKLCQASNDDNLFLFSWHHYLPIFVEK